MRIEPARVDQIRSASDGRMVLIDADVAGVAADLHDYDPLLRVRFAEAATPPYFVVYREIGQPDGQVKQELVLTAQQLDHRIVNRVREIDSQSRSGYDFVAEVDRQNARAEREKLERRHERFGEQHEHLAHALRKDFGVKNRIFVGRDV